MPTMDPVLEEVFPSDARASVMTDLGIGFNQQDLEEVVACTEQVSNEIDKVEDEPVSKAVLYRIHFESLLLWFLRSSSSMKLKFFHRMLQKLKDESYLDVILLTLNYHMDKMRVYSQSLPNTNYIYDIKVNDHNRTMEKNFLEETFNMELVWFESLPPHVQMETIVDLLRRTGADLVDKFYDLALKCKKDGKPIKPSEDDTYALIVQRSCMYSKVALQHEMTKTPAMTEIETKRKAFDDALNQYKNQVMGVLARTPGSGKRSGKSSAKKSNKNSRKSKRSSKGSPTSAKSRGKKGEMHLIDQIQLLPIWIVTKIFSYFDNRTLQKLRNVNNYWAQVIDDMVKEKSCRKYMDKVIKKMETNMNYVLSDDSSLPKAKAHKMSKAQRRTKELSGRAAIHPKLRTTNSSKVIQPTLLERTAQEGASHLVMPTTGYESFPRNVPNNQTLLETPACALNELGKQPYRMQDKARMKSNTMKIGLSDSELLDEEKKYGRKSVTR